MQLEANVGSPLTPRDEPPHAVQRRAGARAHRVRLRDALDTGRSTTFTVRADATEEGWRIIDLIQHAYDTCAPLQEYPAGSAGPQAA
ncbi:hypothetical protein QJS66_14930 [Kocuria rhizophila]|nr:hypothetical protein QJS66_14930 [Kocuria rhizophila]